MAKKKTVEEKYKSLSEVEHIIHRSGMYIGSIKNETSQLFLYSSDDAKMRLKEAEYSPGMLKLIDEIISNSCDEYRRKDNLGLNKISVLINKNGHVEVEDNGGIPVVMHKDAGCYVPEFIFGQLRTSSNYDDTEERDVVGTNGIGSVICNIFSTKFTIETADGKKSFHRSWKNNMEEMCDDLKIESSNEHYTRTIFDIDFKHFECGKEFSEDFIDIIEKRCIDAAAANPGLIVQFTYKSGKKIVRKNTWHFRKFEHYIELYSDFIDLNDCSKFSDNMKSVWIYPEGNINIGFVNGAFCSKGTHIKAIRNEINTQIAEYIQSKKKLDIGARNVDNKYSMFCIYSIANPSYNSQDKAELTTPVERFSLKENFKFTIPNTFIKDILKSDIVNQVIDWYNQKMEVEDQKTIRKLNKQAKTKIRNNDKFIDANSKKREDRELWIFEGDSARSGFRASRNPQTQAGLLLRGVIYNSVGSGPVKIMANKELSDIITILGLQWGQKNDPAKLNFNKIIIATDADFDGSKIAGLLLAFFNHFPELYEAGMVYRSISPIVTATKGKDTKYFFTMQDFRNAEESGKLKGYSFRYLKGLGGMTNDLYKDMLQNPILHRFVKDDIADMTIKSWFGKGIAHERKEILKSEV